MGGWEGMGGDEWLLIKSKNGESRAGGKGGEGFAWKLARRNFACGGKILRLMLHVNIYSRDGNRLRWLRRPMVGSSDESGEERSRGIL